MRMRGALLLTLLAAGCARSDAEWAAAASAPDPFLRALAVTALAETDGGLLLLVDALDDPDPQVREAADAGLQRLGARAVPTLLEGLRPGAPDSSRERALVTLPRLGEAAAAPLAAALLDGEHEQKAVLQALEQLGPRAGRPALAPLIEALGAPGESARRAAAAQGLLAVDATDRDALPALIRAAHDADPRVRDAALEAAVGGLLSRLRSGDGLTRHASEVELETLGAAALPSLARALRAAPRGEEDVPLAALAAHGPAALPAAFDALNPRDPRHIERAGRLAAALGPEALPALLALLDDVETQRRLLAMVGLGALRAEARSAVPRLLEELTSSDTFLRWGAAYALGLIGPADDSQLDTLLSATQGADNILRSRLAPGLVDALLDRLVSQPDEAGAWRERLALLGADARPQLALAASGDGPRAALAAQLLAAP